MEIALGHIVYSKAGRDKGKKFVVVRIIDSEYIMISDGSLRRLERPKKKKLKHIEVTEEILNEISDKLGRGQKVTNAEVRKALAASQ